MDKDEKRALLQEFREDSILKHDNLIKRYIDDYNNNEKIECDLLKDNIDIKFCETKEEVQKWKAYTMLTSSNVYRNVVGRQVKVFVTCNNHILGMLHFTSPLAQMKARDSYLQFTDKWQELKGIYNIEICVPTRKYANLLTGKLLVYLSFTKEIQNYLEKKYNNNVIGFETTSLYGKSSIYNRIPFLKYLGTTEGLSAVYIKDDDWAKIIKEYHEKYPNTKTNRLAPVKFQIVDKLSSWYASRKIDFPYQYKSESFKRGIYFGYCQNVTKEEAIENWRKRWLIGRIERSQRKDLEK